MKKSIYQFTIDDLVRRIRPYKNGCGELLPWEQVAFDKSMKSTTKNEPTITMSKTIIPNNI